MEAAPLSLAHSHARNASFETQKANPIAASEEHDLAAGEFANAAKGTADAEALRTLRILELHHSKLAEILKFKPEDAQPLPSQSPSAQSPELSQIQQLAPKTTSTSPRHISHHPSSPLQVPHRELSSSIASNLASARGIPASRQRWGNQSPAQISPQLAEGRVVNPPRRSRLTELDLKGADSNEKNPAKATLSSSNARVANADYSHASGSRAPPPPVATAALEDPFSRFYSTFNNLVSTLSAPLAFAGLPLNPSSATQANSPGNEKQHSPQQPRAPAADPDLTRIFSRAALRAVREENGFGPVAESFYVVPTSGGTMTYAGMLSHARQGSSLTDEDSEFVDASENPQSASPIQSRHGRQRHSSKSNTYNQTVVDAATEARRKPPAGVQANKTWEELTIENEALRNVVVDLGDRLRAFELGAQKSSLALHASMRQFSSPTASASPGVKIPPMPGSGAAPISSRALEERIKELEEEITALKKDNRKLGRENQKYVGVINRYRERWESLKEGARERVKGASASGGGEVTSREAEQKIGD